MQNCDVLIHINEMIEENRRVPLEHEMEGQDGVLSAHFSSGHEHLVMLEYNPDRTAALAILNKVRDMGYSAQIVAI